jgi:hypothetical protein
MSGISIPGIGIALATLAIALFPRVPKLRIGKPKRPERWEKAEIIRQLLALSELEDRRAARASSVRFSAPTSTLGTRPSHANLKTTAKSTLPIRPKTS